MWSLLAYIVVTLILPLLINKSTEDGRFDRLKLYLREVWTALFAFFSLFLLHQESVMVIVVKQHGRWKGPLGYVVAGIVGAALLCAYWWFTGKVFTEQPKSGANIEYRAVADITEASLIVTNVGTVADVWASLDITGPVLGKKRSIFGRWEHTNSFKARIAKGQSCKLLLATRKSDPNFITVKWHIPYADGDGVGGMTESLYSSMIENKDAQADDIHLYVRLFADPDCLREVKECHVVLHAVKAEELGS